MEQTLHVLATWLHILGVATWIGPQVLLAVGWPGAAREITDPMLRVNATRVMTARFGRLGLVALVIIAASGLYLFLSWWSYYAVPGEAGFFSLRFGVLFAAKMAVVAVMMAATLLHMYVVGPRQLAAMGEAARGAPGAEARLAVERRRSRSLSVASLLLSVLLAGAGAALGTPGWALQEI